MLGSLVLMLLMASGVRGGVVGEAPDPEPARIRTVEPAYPPGAAREDEEADVVLRCTVDGSGMVLQAMSLNGSSPFSEAATAAARQWQYEPSKEKQYRVFDVAVRFRLAHKAIHREPFPTVFDAARSATDGPRRHDAWRELFDRGPRILNELVHELELGDDARRCAALPFLDRLGERARRASAPLLALLRRSRTEERPPCPWGATLALVAPEAHALELKRAVSSRDAALCRSVLSGLWTKVPLPDSMPTVLEDPDRDVRSGAVRALAAMGLSAREAGPALLRALAREEPNDPKGRGPDLRQELHRAIVATRADKDDARLRVEDDIRAAVVARVVAEGTQEGRSPQLTVVVLGETSPRGLIDAMARRGLSVPPGPLRVVMDEVVWKAGDLVEVKTTFDGGMDSSGTTYVVALVDGRWTVVGTGGG